MEEREVKDMIDLAAIVVGVWIVLSNWSVIREAEPPSNLAIEATWPLWERALCALLRGAESLLLLVGAIVAVGGGYRLCRRTWGGIAAPIQSGQECSSQVKSDAESEVYGRCLVCKKRTQIRELRKIDSGEYVCLRCLADIRGADTGSSDAPIVTPDDVGQ